MTYYLVIIINSFRVEDLLSGYFKSREFGCLALSFLGKRVQEMPMNRQQEKYNKQD
jgi:hypothetical protein